MMNEELIHKLKSQTATADDASVDDWLALARAMRGLVPDFENNFIPVQLIARIQVLLVNAGLLTDEEFMRRLTGAPWFNQTQEVS